MATSLRLVTARTVAGAHTTADITKMWASGVVIVLHPMRPFLPRQAVAQEALAAPLLQHLFDNFSLGGFLVVHHSALSIALGADQSTSV